MIEHIVLASHGTLAEGIYRAASVILGEQALAHVEVLNCYVDETQDVAKQIADIAKRCHERSVVFTDLFGGSVNNQFYAYMQQQGYLLICPCSSTRCCFRVIALRWKHTSALVWGTICSCKKSAFMQRRIFK